ncbi:hypothetical protein BASA81_000197 [Batrachochytrium salamandrivorans]|nr:hypothetical protein BASA81_000197 [Batrachochytrium salamandrivorans]
MDQAKELERRLRDGNVVEPASKSFWPLAWFFSGPQAAQRCFYGEDFIRWAVSSGLAESEAKAVDLGQTLLDHRLARHITDDSNDKFLAKGKFSLLSQEPPQVQQWHQKLGERLDHSRFQGQLFWGGEKPNQFSSVYAVLTPDNSLEGYKARSAASPPLFTVGKVTKCEEVSVKPEWTCFQVSNEAGDQAKLCADHSSKQESWLQALVGAGERAKFYSNEPVAQANSLFEFTARKIDSDEVAALSQYRGKVCVVVNVASKCGLYKRDYTELCALHKEFAPQGFEILAFPTNEFGAQEPGPEGEILANVQQQFGVNFPVFGKVLVNGPHAHPVFRFLKSKLGGVLGSSVKWNYTKFLCDRDGVPVKRYAPAVSPSAMRGDILRLLSSSISRVKL